MGIKVAKYLPNKVSIACFILSGLFFILYKGIGSHVDIDGMLVEPFHLIPLGYLFLFVGMITLLFQFFLNTFLINIIKKQMVSIQTFLNPLKSVLTRHYLIG